VSAAAPEGEISVDDPRAADVLLLLQRHLEFARTHTRPEDVYALDVDGLVHPAVTFYSFRRRGQLLAVGALKQLDPRHAELKSMHTAAAERGRGIGRAMVDHLLGVAWARGYYRVSLETGSMAVFAPARSLYAGAGFTPCGPFGDYPASDNSAFMTLLLDGVADGAAGAESDPVRSPGWVGSWHSFDQGCHERRNGDGAQQ
jgi:putative acetyltransferase